MPRVSPFPENIQQPSRALSDPIYTRNELNPGRLQLRQQQYPMQTHEG